MRELGAFVQLSRLHFLMGGFVLFALGAFDAGVVGRSGYLVGQVMVTSTQITAHYVNEYADRETDRGVGHRTLFSGGSGVLGAGALAPVVALRAARVTTGLALVTALVVATRSMPAALIGVACLTISWIYSMPPVRLLGTGWGELATSIVVSVAVPTVGSLSMGRTPGLHLWVVMTILLRIHMAMMLTFELPDLESDETAGKRVLGVRLGTARTRRVIVLLLTLAALLALRAGDALATVGLLPAATLLMTIRSHRYSVMTLSAVATLSSVAVAYMVHAIIKP